LRFTQGYVTHTPMQQAESNVLYLSS